MRVCNSHSALGLTDGRGTCISKY